MHGRSTPVGLYKSIGVGTVVALVTIAVGRSFGIAEGLRGFDLWVGVSTGAVLSVFVWMLLRPRARFTRGALIAVAINCAAWAAFLVLTPLVSDTEFQQIADQRAARDAGAHFLISDQPTVMASRWFGGFRSMPASERLLFLMAGVPVLLASEAIVPVRYIGDPPTRGESWIIAAIGFTASTAFWGCAGAATQWLRERRLTGPANRPLQPSSTSDDAGRITNRLLLAAERHDVGQSST